MKELPKKPKPTLDSMLQDNRVITGKKLIEQREEAERQKSILQEAIEFEERNRRQKGR